jgi:hypothetical protein
MIAQDRPNLEKIDPSAMRLPNTASGNCWHYRNLLRNRSES